MEWTSSWCFWRRDDAAHSVGRSKSGVRPAGRIKGGRSEDQWKGEFLRLVGRRRAIERRLDETNPNRSHRKAELKGALEEVDRQMSLLESEADDAHVPMQWRD